MKVLSAVEFFSGIGAFAEAAHGSNVVVISAFDQNAMANLVYKHNFSLQPVARNLDSISASQIPDSDMWWLSPPCTPFSIRGRQKDHMDTRARALINLISLIPSCLPELILLENVNGFVGSHVHNLLCTTLDACGYVIKELHLCSSQFGVPMRRPRYFLLASQMTLPEVKVSPAVYCRQPVARFLIEDVHSELTLGDDIVLRYGGGFDVVDPKWVDSEAICFTSGYGVCMRASGSVLLCEDGRLRYFAPEEIIRLLGFSLRFTFPDSVNLKTRLHLAGNSVDVRCIRYLLAYLGLVSNG